MAPVGAAAANARLALLPPANKVPPFCKAGTGKPRSPVVPAPFPSIIANRCRRVLAIARVASRVARSKLYLRSANLHAVQHEPAGISTDQAPPNSPSRVVDAHYI